MNYEEVRTAHSPGQPDRRRLEGGGDLEMVPSHTQALSVRHICYGAVKTERTNERINERKMVNV